jgi:hypothetical protein
MKLDNENAANLHRGRKTTMLKDLQQTSKSMWRIEVAMIPK